VSIPSVDIVLDVARAADPERYREAVQRLTELRSSAASTQPASAPINSEQRAAPAFSPQIEANAIRHEPARPRGRLNAYGQFEAFLLQTFVQSMLPKNATNVYGKGTAGEVWRSMLAERIGEELAKSGQVGVAERLESSVRQPTPAASEASPGAIPSSGQRPASAAVPASSEAVAEVAQWSTLTQTSTDRS
jgi:flagellar protein FlgJ